MKRIKIITLITLLCFVFTIPAFAAVDWDKESNNYDVKVFMDTKDNELKFPAGMDKPFIAEGRTFVPYRIMCEALGAKVDWNQELRKVTTTGNNSKVKLFIGKSTYRVNGVKKEPCHKGFWPILKHPSNCSLRKRTLVYICNV